MHKKDMKTDHFSSSTLRNYKTVISNFYKTTSIMLKVKKLESQII